MDVDINQILGVITILSVVGGGIASFYWGRLKGAFSLFVEMWVQDGELLQKVKRALDDDLVTQEEFKEIFKEFEDSRAATLALLNKLRG